MAASAPLAEASKRGGTLRLAAELDYHSLDPALVYTYDEGTLAYLVFNPLLDVDRQGNLIPVLLKRLPDVAPDRLTYTFELRTGILFSHGRELVADDVIFSIERIIDPNMASPYSAFFRNILGRADFEEARKNEAASIAPPQHGQTKRWISPTTLAGLRNLDRYRFQIRLSQPDSTLLPYLGTPAGMIVPREEVSRLGKQFGVKPIGTGPFILKEWVRDARMRFERNPRYIQPGQPYLYAVEVGLNIDRSAQAMMFERGELDAQLWIGDPDFIRYRKDRKMTSLMSTIHGNMNNYISLNCEMGPFTNRLVRQAMNYAVNKEALVKKSHYRVVPSHGVLPMNVKGFNTNLPAYSYNPDKARSLLAQAGFHQGFETTLWVAGSGDTLALSIQQDLEAVGIKVQLKEVSKAVLTDAIGQRHKVPMGSWDWAITIDDPKDTLDTLFNSDGLTDQGCLNVAFYSNPAVQSLLRAANVDFDDHRRLRRYQQVEELIVQDAPWIFLCMTNTEILTQPWLKGLLLRGTYPTVRIEQCWLER